MKDESYKNDLKLKISLERISVYDKKIEIERHQK